MAFQQSARAPPQRARAARSAIVEDDDVALQVRAASEERVQESQTWVLFSPPTDTTTTSYLTETEHSLDTPGRSRLSDLGSVQDPTARSARHDRSTSFSAVDDGSVEDDGELDSLDSHLPEFRSHPGAQTWSESGLQHPLPVLPTHDGLGSFRFDQPLMGRDVLEQIYQFERFNPRRVRRRLDSFDGGLFDAEHGQNQEEEKRQRIEAWRLEHSRTLIDEVQRETRRRRKSQASMHRATRSRDAESDDMTWHDEDAVESGDHQPDGFLATMTRKLIKDMLGIDDRLLSVLLGESLLADDDGPTTPRASPTETGTEGAEEGWQLEMLNTLSREVGMLVNHLSHHPGAFSTYARMQQMAIPYAGLPVIPETADTPRTAAMSEAGRRPRQPSLPAFQPTMRQLPPTLVVPDRRVEETTETGNEAVGMDDVFTKDEWERSLDVKLVFRYVLSHFAPQPKTQSPGAHTNASTAQDGTAKISRVRQHHPLIARSRAADRRSFKATVPASSPVALRHHSSCASQSTRRSARRSSCSSRHYWDIGGSLGTGSMIASHGPMGSWGEI
ncbi:hypothetical protein DCS_01610 [Drechmeria coniospora]|uniref:Uncharacterized protein n=1 Tax=Drechmeria coniospora TaxID=98403 RepID=A0A151GTU0_DRECN|nr:hypothetical protein DCS_01610 [Drechmeria coniospora]KYK60473.1 hypothetical protein DCS_01610 [Drechmeria coniospora]